MTVQFSGVSRFSASPRMSGAVSGSGPQFSSARFGSNEADSVDVKSGQQAKDSGGCFSCRKLITVPLGAVIGSVVLSPLPIIGPFTGALIGGLLAAKFL